MTSLINKTKFGDCSQCGATDTDVVKVAKSLFCVPCHKNNKVKEQMRKANEKVQVRSLNVRQKENGFIDSRQELIIDLDRVVSRYIRLRDMEPDRMIRCYTCGKKVKWEKAHCSHFINRAEMATRWNTHNLKSSCPECNVNLHGNLKVYAENLEKEQPGIVEFLREQARAVTNIGISELKELLIDFQFKLKMVETKLK